jgi:tellurite resistance-related uncharacterized protein
MNRSVTGFHRDIAGDWVAELDCGHDQHVRHRPPFELRPWVIEEAERSARIGSPLPCPLCDRFEAPAGLRWVRTTPVWNEESVPPGLRQAHRVAPGTWGRIRVREGRLRLNFGAAADPIELGPGSSHSLPPGFEHDVTPLGSVRFEIDFFTVGRPVDTAAEPGLRWPEGPGDEGGDPVCWSGLLCPECGALVVDGRHRPECPLGRPAEL